MRLNPLQQWLGHVNRLPRKRQASAKWSRRATLRRLAEPLEDRLMLSALSPADVRKAYGIDQIKFGAAGVAGNGAGETIALVVIGADASLISDLQYFDQQLFGSGSNGSQLLDTFGSYNGPQAGSTKPWFDVETDPNFPFGNYTAAQISKHDVEADIDVEWAHAIAPMANIVVVQTGSIQSGTGYASDLRTLKPQLGISIIASSSYNFPLFRPQDYADPNVTYVGITGDTGTSVNSEQTAFSLDNFPASSPDILAVGGTTLSLNPDGSYGSETGWGFAGPNAFVPAGMAVVSNTQGIGGWDLIPGGFSGEYQSAPYNGFPDTFFAQWSMTVPSGITRGLNDNGLEVSATWPARPENVDNATFSVYLNGTFVQSVNINEQIAPEGNASTLGANPAVFQELCTLTGVKIGDTIRIVLQGTPGAGQDVVADAVGFGPDDASGGGLSATDQPQPSFQNGLVIHDGSTVISSNGTRAYPDVAFDGDYINSPVEFYDQGSVIEGQSMTAIRSGAGTSLGAPAWAGLIAIVDQGLATVGHAPISTAQALAGLYSLPSRDFHDETSGYNGYSAGPGYDLVTGLGSPVANLLVPDLARTVAPVPGPLTYEAPEEQAPINLALIQVGTNIEIIDNSSNILASAPLAQTTAIDIIGAANTSNTLTIEFGSFSSPIAVNFDGGGGTLVLEGGTFQSEVDNATGPHSGTITLDNSSITYANLTPIVDTTTATTLTIDDPMPGDAITVQIDPNGALNGVVTSEIVGSGFEKIDLANKTTVVFVNTSSVLDTIDLVNPLVGNATFIIEQLTAPPRASIIENTSLVFSNLNADPISITDSAAGTNLEQFTLAATHGGLNLASTNGLTFTSGSNGSSSMTVRATLANLNAALDGLKFTPTTGYLGPAPLTITYEDPSLNQVRSTTTAISVVVPPSKPTVKIQAPLQALEGLAATFKFVVSDTNATAQAAAFQFAISFGDGTIKKVTSKSPLQLSHVFTRFGTFTVIVVATDIYGHTSARASATIKVVPVPIVPRALANQAALQIPGVAIDEAATAPDSLAIADNPSADLVYESIQWAGLSAAIDVLNDWNDAPWK
jgi:hypothetical protein